MDINNKYDEGETGERNTEGVCCDIPRTVPNLEWNDCAGQTAESGADCARREERYALVSVLQDTGCWLQIECLLGDGLVEEDLLDGRLPTPERRRSEKGQGVLTARQLGLWAAEAHRHTFAGRAVEFSSCKYRRSSWSRSTRKQARSLSPTTNTSSQNGIPE